jgi:hypothetical protein
MKSATVHINELRVRVTGLTPEQAQRLGELVAQQLSELSVRVDRSQRIPSASVQVRSSGSSSLEQTADGIVAGIRRSLA